MQRTVRDKVRELAEAYRDAAPEEKRGVAQQAADLMADAGLDQADSVELWYEVVWELVEPRWRSASPRGESGCDRCGQPAIGTICSTFNTEQICMACKSQETRHPEYEAACRAEHEAVEHGEFNFPGIGKPADL